AVETVTISASARLAPSWPTAAFTPTDRRRSRLIDRLRSLPVTRWPMAASTVAMALMPAPPTPITWMRRGWVRSSSATGHPTDGVLVGQGRHRPGGIRAAQGPGRPAHGVELVL